MLARLGFAAALVAVAALLSGSAAPAGVRAAPLPHVTVFGDSIAEAIVENDSARAILAHGKVVLLRARDGVHYLPAAGDMVAQAILLQLGRVYDLRSS